MKELFNKLKIETLIMLQLIISMVMTSFIFVFEIIPGVGLILPSYLVYLPTILSFIILFLFLLEFIKKRRVGRLIYLVIAILLTIITQNSIESLNSYIWFFSFIYLVIVLIIYTKTKTSIKVSKEKKELPVAIYSRKHLVLNNLLILFVFLFDVVFISIWYVNYNLNIIAGLALAFIISFIFIIFMSSLINPLSKPIRLMNNEVKFNEAYKLLEELKNNEMLHQDNIEYIKIFQSDYYALVNKQRSLEIFETINEPEFKEYKKIYHLLKFCYFINKDEINNAKEQLDFIKRKHFYNKNGIERLEKMIDINDGKTINNIELIYKTNTKNKFLNVINANNLMEYYERQGNIEKAKENAKIILLDGKELIETYNKALYITKK